MKDVKIRISADTADAKKGIDDVAKSTNNLKGSTNELGGAVDGMTGGAVTAFKKFATGLKGIALGFKTIGGAIAASGIGLIVVTIAALTAAFRGSEEGQNKFAKIMGVIGAVTGNLVDLLADLGEKIISVFENPKQAIRDFANSIKTNITNRFDGLMELVPALGKAIDQLFSGEFSAAAETAGNAFAKVTLGVDDLSGKLKDAAGASKDFINQNLKEGAAAAKVADMRAKADKIERKLITDRANAEREISELRVLAKDLNNTTAEERETALKKVMALQDSLIGQEQEVANLRRDAQVQENTFARSNKKNLDEAARLTAEAIAVETRRNNAKRRIQTELTLAENQIAAAAKAKKKEGDAAAAEQTKKDKEAAKAKIELKKKIAEFSAVTEEEQRELEKDKLRINFEELLSQLGEDEDAKLELTKSYLKKQKELKDKFAEEDAAKAKEDGQKEIDALKAVEDAKASVRDAALGTISNGLGLLRQLGEDNKALQATALIGESAVGIAEMVINKSKADLVAAPIVANPATAGAGAAILAMNKVNLGIGIASNVAATAKGLQALGRGGAPQGGAEGQGGAQAPSFNLVEGTDDSSAIQRTIEGRGNAPIKAFVTSGDITTAQQADRQAELNSGF